MDVVATRVRFVTGRSEAAAAPATPRCSRPSGVYQGMRAGPQHLWGAPRLAGRLVGIAGVGKVGHLLAGAPLADGATVVVTDVNDEAVRRVLPAHPEVEAVATTAELLARRSTSTPRAPWATPSPTRVVDDAARPALVCGGANNQLAHAGCGRAGWPTAACSTCPTSWSTPAG